MDLRIKEITKRKGLTQKELADKMGVSLSAVKQMLGADSLTTSTLEKIASALDCSVADFFRAENPQPPQFTAMVRNGNDTFVFDDFDSLRDWVGSNPVK